MVVMVLGLEVLTNHIGIDYEGTMGSSIGSFDGMTYGGGTCGFIARKSLQKNPDAEMVGSGCGP